MDVNDFDRLPDMTPLLVRLYDSHKLYSLVKEDKPLARAELTRAVTDLFERDLKPKEQELLADVLIGLMRQAERDLRQALAEKLAGLPHVPLRLILHLANDDITVAAPVLRKSMVLSDLDLIYIIKSQGPDYWQAIAGRERMNNDVIDVLADTRDIGTAVVLSNNDRVTLTRHAMAILGEMARNNDAIAKPLLMRPEMPESLAKELYRYVGNELKAYISAFYNTGQELQQAVSAVDELILEFVEPTPRRLPEFMPTEQMVMLAQEQATYNMLNMDMMMDALQKGKIPVFIAQFAAYTGIPAQKVHDFLRQSCPKGMAIACRAFRVQKNDFSRIYLMTHRMRSRNKLVNHTDMLNLLQYFDKVRPEVAMRIVQRAG
ncbi:MAG: DUF2336 domain-containing protein [Rhodospirillales bacterium]|nr:DUF2336 domain-containing protein [Rhodospirillales bacterium]MCB9995932.1 DUF2336 domain-containing protein [Rhodospirillales bacterium]